MAVTITFDTSDLMRGLDLLDKRVISAAKKGRGAVGDELLRLSQREVPHDEGTLANSGVSEVLGGDQVVSYNTAYAARLHEHPEYNFQAGRKGKYLQEPMQRNLKAFTNIFGDEVKASL